MEIAHGGKVIVQQRRGVAQRLGVGVVLERVENLFEHLLPLADARVDGGPDVVRSQHALTIDGGMLASEMNPVDGPRLLAVGPIGVGQSGRQNEELVLRDCYPSAACLVPSAAIHAIDEHILIDRLSTLTEMAVGIGIVANVGDVEARHERVVALSIDGHGRQHNRAFARETVLHNTGAKIVIFSIISKRFFIY